MKPTRNFRRAASAVAMLAIWTIALESVATAALSPAPKAGLRVLIGCRDVSPKVFDSAAIVQFLDTDPQRVARARAIIKIRSAGCYGRVSAEHFDGAHLPYADNLVNVLEIRDPEVARRLEKSEIMRVLAPGGRCGAEVKPRPTGMDEWPQWLHGPSNVPVSRDTLVGPPRHLQWMGGAPWSRMHNDIDVPTSVNLVLADAGRIFYDTDNGLPDSDKMPSHFHLIARDAFNGALLWKIPLPDWYAGEEYRRGNPPLAIQRRIVCAGDVLYITKSDAAPVVVLDAATGATLRSFPGTEGARELVLGPGGKLFAVVWKDGKPVRDGYNIRRGYASKWKPGDPPEKSAGKHDIRPAYRETVKTELLALDPESGKTLWRRTDAEVTPIFPQTIGADDQSVYFKTPEHLCRLDSSTGKTLWAARIGEPLTASKQYANWFLLTRPNYWYNSSAESSRVMVLADRILTVAQNKLFAVSKTDGKVLWTGPSYSSFFLPPDILPVGDMVYVGTKMGEGGFIPLDLESGKVKPEVKLEKDGMVHHRCYRRLATTKYLLTSKAGVEFHDIANDTTSYNSWTRGNCFAGFLPANGHLYVTAHPCACFTRTRMNGMLAYAPARKDDTPYGAPVAHQLETGPAFGDTPPANEPGPGDWPDFRHDAARSGATTAVVCKDSKTPGDLKPKWSLRFGGKLSPVTVAGGRLYLAQVDAHTVHCLDAESGDRIWSFTAGGRVDTPPSIRDGLAVFGCRDGWVYCLRADDGRLVWRFHAAPLERRIGVFDQLESAWPLHGALVVQKQAGINEGRPVVYLNAGRNTYLDSGVLIFALDLKTGKVVAKHDASGPYDAKGNPVIEKLWVCAGLKNDVLVSDGEYLYIKDIAFNPDCTEAATKGNPHLIATGRSLLDEYWHHRSLWVIDTETPYLPNGLLSGNLVCFRGSDAYTFRSHTGGRNSQFSPAQNYELRRSEILPEARKDKTAKNNKTPPKPPGPARGVWGGRIDIIAKAMVLAGAGSAAPSKDVLFLAGVRNPKVPVKVEAALQGKMGGLLYAMSTKDGRKLCELPLPSLPVYDGMAATPGHLYLALRNGEVICLE